jgi:ribosome-associated translation inhibitor RaiA
MLRNGNLVPWKSCPFRTNTLLWSKDTALSVTEPTEKSQKLLSGQRKQWLVSTKLFRGLKMVKACGNFGNRVSLSSSTSNTLLWSQKHRVHVSVPERHGTLQSKEEQKSIFVSKVSYGLRRIAILRS